MIFKWRQHHKCKTVRSPVCADSPSCTTFNYLADTPELGIRDYETFRKMYERLKKWNVKVSLAIVIVFIVILYHMDV